MLWFTLVLVSLGGQFSTFALSTQVQLKPSNFTNTPCSVTVTPVDEGVQFHFSCRTWQQTNVNYHAALRLYKGISLWRAPELVAICPIEKVRDGDFWRCEFTVTKPYLEDSRFHFTINVIGHPSADQYWFYLRDFAGLKSPAKKKAQVYPEKTVNFFLSQWSSRSSLPRFSSSHSRRCSQTQAGREPGR